MADSSRFASDLLRLLGLDEYGGEAMIAVSRAVLRERYSNEEFDEDFFSIFILIDDESDDIVLQGYGNFNFPSQRHALTGKSLVDSVRAIASSHREEFMPSNNHIYSREIEVIADTYKSTFLSSLGTFIDFFGLRNHNN